MAPSKSPRLLLAIFALAAATIATAFEEISSDRCDCFLTSGNTSNYYFSGHKFFDFRSLPEHAGVPARIENAYRSSYAEPASAYFAAEEWTSTWGIQGWNNSASLAAGVASVLMVHSPNNVYIEANSDEGPAASETFMTLRTIRLQDFQSSAEFESIDHGYQFVSLRMLARTTGAPGAITAMFTYRGADELSRVQESDLEFRTLDPPGAVHFTNQPAYTEEGVKIDKATRNVTIPGELTYEDWAVYRMDWTPGDTTWFINGEEVASIDFQTPRDPSVLMFNSWSDGGNW
ncbi:putative glycoside hydrolase family 16 protein [Eutypa lata UCREL1]|uniref:Putative glycoside hydrolase family 16 protein n=1 Tax=Eutypa lata (strain UCR-EL1) TaxID=1287681 RepID=M7T0U5_EUTLA|nr:putative glycoside hydrolase family 16 protein [Eutypa lata UCREL1]